MDKNSFVSGITLRSIFACLTGLLLAGIYTQYAEVIVCTGDAPAEQILPIPLMAIFLPLILISGLCYACFRVRLLNKAEMLCVFFAILMAVPMMTQGMWHRFVALIADPARESNFQYLDAFNDNLWPHGENLSKNLLRKENAKAFAVKEEAGAKPAAIDGGDGIKWESCEYEAGKADVLPTLVNTSVAETRGVRLAIPLADGKHSIVPTEAHLLSVLLKAENMGPDSLVIFRVLEDDQESGVEVFSTRSAGETTNLHRKGFVRLGSYGVKFSRSCKKSITLEFSLKGKGVVRFADPRFFSVQTLEGVYKGRKVITQKDLEKIPEEARTPEIVVRPDSLWSVAGVKYLLEGYIPVRDWATPIFAWGSFIFLLLAGILAINIIMRKQWAEHERFPLPNAQIPAALMGLDSAGGDDSDALPPVWKNGTMWAGFAIAFIYGAVKCWSLYNTAVPNPAINVPLKPYFMDASWGTMWDTNFSVYLFVVSIAIFFDLNVLASLFVGYWLFRFLGMAKNWMDIGTNPSYPWRHEQTIGSYIGYFFAVLFFTRKYLWGVIKQAFRGGKGDELDVLSSRGALLLLIASAAGVALWAWWLETPIGSIMLFFGFLLLMGFVASRLRSECGLAGGYFTPYNAMLLVAACGGISAFGSSSVLVATIFSGFLSVTVFFFIPGAQLELMQLGQGIRLKPSSVVWACVLGLFGGLVVGGWVFLSNAYAFGGDSIVYQWPFKLSWFFSDYKADFAKANAALASGVAGGGVNYGGWTMVIWGVLVAVLTAVRQFFSGFWFHPVGIIFGSTHMMSDFAWGSILAALVIRYLVLKFGGAMAVRNRLKPFFVGCLVGSVTVMVMFHGLAAYLKLSGATKIFGVLP